MVSYKTCAALIAGLVVLPLGVTAAAQDYSATPTYGTISLTSGFTPDPVNQTVQSGGSIDASRVGCTGYIANAPDYRINYTAGTYPLLISVSSQADTTLVVSDAVGNWLCDDDSGQGTNPSIRVDNPVSGQYDIWIGTYGSGDLEYGQLMISELFSH